MGWHGGLWEVESNMGGGEQCLKCARAGRSGPLILYASLSSRSQHSPSKPRPGEQVPGLHTEALADVVLSSEGHIAEGCPVVVHQHRTHRAPAPGSLCIQGVLQGIKHQGVLRVYEGCIRDWGCIEE